MTAQTILPANSVVDSGFNVANSVNCGDESTRWTGANKVTSTSQQKGSWNIWLKRTVLGEQGLFKVYESANTGVEFKFDSSDQFLMREFESGSDVFNLKTSAVFRDTSAWMNILLAIDTTQGTEANRIRLYINGVEPSLATSTRPSANTNLVRFFANGADSSNQQHEMGNNYDGATGHYLLTQILHVDGTQLANTDVGEFDEDSGIWKPIDISETTLGNNGYYLSMEDSSNFGVATGKAMTAHGFAATDSRTDTCTNNFATLNALATGLDATLSEGNLKMVSGTATTRSGTASSIGLTAGKWFAEFKITGSANGIVGIAGTTQNRTATDDDDIGNYPGRTQQGYGYLSGGEVYNDSSAVTGSFATFTTDDIIGVAVDLDGDLLYFYKNGAIQNSGTGIDISGITPHSGNWFFAVGDGSGSTASTVECNFGNPITALSSAVADGKGFGSFEFTPKSGHLALCTKNLGSNG